MPGSMYVSEIAEVEEQSAVRLRLSDTQFPSVFSLKARLPAANRYSLYTVEWV